MPLLHPVALSALQHFLYCPRQCALIHVEREWAENRSTAEGRVLHERAHEGKGETRPGVRIARGLAVSSAPLGLTGVCDVVEIWDDGRLVPVEYKRGRPKAHRADEVQLCGQAICLEATFSRPVGSIASGFLYYGQKRRRTEVLFDPALRALTLDLAEQVRAMIETARTPTAEYQPGTCDRCSLLALCQPHALRLRRGADAWFKRNLEAVLAP